MMSGASAAPRPLAGLFVVVLGASLPTMDLAVNVAFPAITSAFALETRAIRWVIVCYVVTYASLMLAFGQLGDRLGYRRVFRLGLLVSVAAYVLCAIAPDYRTLLAARVVQGVATALVLSCAPALVTLLFAESKRTKALGAYSGMLAVATIVAPLAGGASIAAAGWEGVFWFRVPVALLALLLLPALANTGPHARAAPAPEPGPFIDRTATGLLALGIALVLLPASLVGTGLPSWAPLPPALAGMAALAAFAHRERRAVEPLVPGAIARDRNFLLLNVAAAAAHFVAFAVPLLVPYHLARVSGLAAFHIGAVIAASPLGMLLGSADSAALAARIGTRRTAFAGAALVAAGSGAIGVLASSSFVTAMAASLLLHGAGIGLFQVAYTDLVVATLPLRARGVAGSLSLVMRTIGVTMSAAVLTLAIERLENARPELDGLDPAPFAAAFQQVFLGCAIVLATVLAATCLRRGLWFSR